MWLCSSVNLKILSSILYWSSIWDYNLVGSRISTYRSQKSFIILVAPRIFFFFSSLVVITKSSLPPSSNTVCNSFPKIRKQRDSNPLCFSSQGPGTQPNKYLRRMLQVTPLDHCLWIDWVCILPHAFNTCPFYFCWSDINLNITCVRFFSQDKVI